MASARGRPCQLRRGPAIEHTKAFESAQSFCLTRRHARPLGVYAKLCGHSAPPPPPTNLGPLGCQAVASSAVCLCIPMLFAGGTRLVHIHIPSMIPATQAALIYYPPPPPQHPSFFGLCPMDLTLLTTASSHESLVECFDPAGEHVPYRVPVWRPFPHRFPSCKYSAVCRSCIRVLDCCAPARSQCSEQGIVSRCAYVQLLTGTFGCVVVSDTIRHTPFSDAQSCLCSLCRVAGCLLISPRPWGGGGGS